MRLLNTETLQFWETYEPAKRYAILSHRWRDEEVSYEDFDLTGQSQELVPPWLLPRIEATKRRKGYQKILDFARVARARGFEWCWVDTCCIDKRSSAELSEAINSMWKWYGRAELCIVYLDDLAQASHPIMREAFVRSEWFRRCWTLQELLAPTSILFCSQSWSSFMRLRKSRVFPSLAERTAHFEGGEDERMPLPGPEAMGLLIEASRIPFDCLGYRHGHKSFSVAARMSWASSRNATRVEDVAYSLLGLFGINMPLLYGEGTKAFNRLQQEIVQSNTDESIFAWRSEVRSDCQVNRCFSHCCLTPSLLAESPAYFQGCGDIHELRGRMLTEGCEDPRMASKTFGIRPATHSITNRGVVLRAGAFLTWQPSTGTTVMKERKDGTQKKIVIGPRAHYYYIMYLRCWDSERNMQCAIVLDADTSDTVRYEMRKPKDIQPVYHYMGSPIDILWRVRSCSLHFSPFANDYDGRFDLDFGIQNTDIVLYAPIMPADNTDDSE